MPAFLAVKNPAGLSRDAGRTLTDQSDRLHEAEAAGHDGARIGTQWIVFAPENVKSASANIGTYSDRSNINFSLPQQPRSAFRVDRAAPAAAASDAHFRKVRDVAKLATAKWGNNRPEVFVLPSPEQLPAEAKQDPRYRMANGFYDGRNIYLVASNLGQNGKVAHAVLKTLTHESIGHYGVERVIRDYLGDGAWDKMTGDMDRMRTRVRAKTAANRQAGCKATAGLSRIEQVVADVERRYGAGTSGRTFAEETLAVLSEQGIRNHWTQQAIAAIRRWIRQYMPELRLSEAELHALLGRSSDFIHHNESYRERVDRVAASAFRRAPAVETANFKRWFKNSKVVGADGQPKHVYHGTDEGFWAFDNAYLSAMTGHMTAPLGFFFTEKQANARAYAAKAADGVPADERVLDVYLSIQKPKPMTMAQFQAIDSFDEARALREKLQRQGFDGIHLTDFDQWVVFEPTQVKMAAENTGGFDAANPDMRFSLDDNPFTRARALETMPAIHQPLALSGLSGAALRTKAKQAYRSARAAGPVVMQDGATVRLSGVGIKKVAMHSADRRVLDIMPSLCQLMARVVPLWEDAANDPEHPICRRTAIME